MRNSKAGSRGRWTILLSAIAVVIAGSSIALFTGAHKEALADVHVVKPSYEDIAKTISTGGKITPVDDFQARASFPGIVEKIYVEVGDSIQPGQILIKMKDPFASSRVATANSALRAAQNSDQNIRAGGSQEEKIALAGDLEHAELTESDAQHSLDALQALQQTGSASSAEVASAQQRLLGAKATLKALQERGANRFSVGDKASVSARVADAAASLDAAKVAFANANITAPQAGRVYSILVSNYDFVPMGAELLHVADLNKVEVRAFFDEPDIGQLAVGQSAKVVWEAKPGRVWHGHMRRAPMAAMVSGTRSVAEGIITVDDAKGDLLPNTNVNVAVTIDQHAHVLTIPRAALFTDGPVRFVFRIVDGKLRRTPVSVGIVNLDHAEITSGIGPQDQVASGTTDGRPLSDNLSVRPVD
jgi:HlyD family secretion protein